jgi:hypothetical protein
MKTTANSRPRSSRAHYILMSHSPSGRAISRHSRINSGHIGVVTVTDEGTFGVTLLKCARV